MIKRKRKPVSLKESKAEQSDDFVLVPGASNWIALKKVSNIGSYVRLGRTCIRYHEIISINRNLD